MFRWIIDLRLRSLLLEGAPALCFGRLQRSVIGGVPGFLLVTCVLVPLAFADEMNPGGVQELVKDNVAVRFAMRTAEDPSRVLPAVEAGVDALLEISLVNRDTASPLSGARPAVWVDRRQAGEDEPTCQEKIRSFLQGSFARRPDMDLNAWYGLALNAGGTITVIDPLIQFGGQRTIALVLLGSPGEDWVAASDGRTLFVTLPEANAVAVVNTSTWKVAKTVPAGQRPMRAALQPDGGYLWVTNEESDRSGQVTVIDAMRQEVRAQLEVGGGPHDLAFSSDDRFAFVTSAASGTLSIIDIRELQVVAQIRTGPRPISVAYSGLSQAAYVADESDGTVTIVHVARPTASTRILADPGLRQIRFSPDGRWAFASNPMRGSVTAIDATRNRIEHVFADAGPGADHITFTDQNAFVRTPMTTTVSLIPWTLLGTGREVGVKTIVAGQRPPGPEHRFGAAPTIAVTPERRSVLIASPQDRVVYYYMEGMNAPMGSFLNRFPSMRSVMALDRSLREVAPGILQTSVRLPKAGTYDVALLMSNPRVAHCFTLTALGDDTGETSKRVQIEYLDDQAQYRAGETARIRLRVTDTGTGEPVDNARDIQVLAVRIPGTWQKRPFAQPLGDGVFEVSLVLPTPGLYWVHVVSPSLEIRIGESPRLEIQAKARAVSD